jgi:protein-glutamine gamma-glutamyltransferase
VESKGWVTVEATPAEGVPSADPRSPRFAWWEALQSDWRRLRSFVSQGRWNRAWSVLRSSGLGVLGGLFLLALASYLAIRIPWPTPFRNRRIETLDPGLAEMQRLLKHVDQQLAPHGLQRGSVETLHQFARRIRNWNQWRIPMPKEGHQATSEIECHVELVAEWYHAYADFRYQGKWDAETLKDLRSRLPQF